MSSSFVSNPDLVREDYKVDDLLDFSEPINSFRKRLNALNRSAVIGFVGKFGSGKSTLLFQLQKNKHEKELWINFDAWKYPERKDLWEGFVLDFADQVGVKKRIQKKIEGKETKSRIVDVATDIVSGITDFLPDLNFLDKITQIFKSSPAKRVFELQLILNQLIHKLKKRICIVVEDIDRSGDAGIYFLETLKQFLGQLESSDTLIVIVPLGTDRFENNIYKESYLKCLDYIEFFQPQIKGIDNFLNKIIVPDLFSDLPLSANEQQARPRSLRRTQISSFMEFLFQYPEMTIRLLKLILRKADLIYCIQHEDGHEPDWRVTICFEASKYFYTNNEPRETYFDSFKKKQVVPKNTIFGILLFTIMGNGKSIYQEHAAEEKKKLWAPKFDFKLVERKGSRGISDYPSWPWHYNKDWSEDEGYGVCDFYSKY